MELFNQRELPCVQDYHFVDATAESDALAKLRKSVIKECLNFKVIFPTDPWTKFPEGIKPFYFILRTCLPQFIQVT